MEKFVGFLMMLLLPFVAYSQQNLSADELFVEARKAAFDKKDYPTSIKLAKQALERAPEYTDISVFLGRVYTWNDDLSSARAVFEGLQKRINKSSEKPMTPFKGVLIS
ncbi:tetratricopeptide repeat protein [Kaistella carnis]|uniref:Tetratricopeptide repeat protein n=1 Tax=Kaistella carnis TaxID=1241979 RepID=A0A3G8XLA1_9FLAO|nr:tetratricopeptide repeat protein [Kaistella carnis]AZI34265.1 tetratricopeptide repeat protein [Kaistella carnis]